VTANQITDLFLGVTDMARRIYVLWEDPVHDMSVLATPADIQSDIERGLLSIESKQVFQIEANTYEEAMAVRNIRLGYDPYRPVGDSAPCPSCAAEYWPEGSGECWQCDHVD
jgi:hypothetical protein